MASPVRAAIPSPPRKTLLNWIDHDEGSTPGTTKPVCSADLQALHAQVLLSPGDNRRIEPLQPPPGLHLAPLG